MKMFPPPRRRAAFGAAAAIAAAIAALSSAGMPPPAARAEGYSPGPLPTGSHILRPDPAAQAEAERRDREACGHLTRAGAFLRKGDLPAAIRAFEEAREADPDVVPWDQYGDTLDAAGRTAEAVEVYRLLVYRAGDARAGGHDWTDGEGRSLQAKAYAAAGRTLFGRGQNADVLMRYALLLSKAGQTAEALQAYAWGVANLSREDRPLFALRLSPARFDRRLFEAAAWTAYGHRGRALWKTSAEDVQIEACRRALSIKRNYAPAWLGLGNALSVKGREPEAREAWRKAVDLGRGEVRAAAQKALAR